METADNIRAKFRAQKRILAFALSVILSFGSWAGVTTWAEDASSLGESGDLGESGGLSETADEPQILQEPIQMMTSSATPRGVSLFTGPWGIVTNSMVVNNPQARVDDVLTYTYTLGNNSSVFTLRLFGTYTRSSTAKELTYVSGSTTLNGVQMPDSNYQDTSGYDVAYKIDFNSIGIDKLKPGERSVITTQMLVNEYGVVGNPITFNNYLYRVPGVGSTPGLEFRVGASSLIPNEKPAYQPGDTLVVKVSIDNQNLDQITSWAINGDIPEGLQITGIRDEDGASIGTFDSDTYSVSGDYINGSDVYDTSGNKVEEPTTKYIYFEIKIKDTAVPGILELPFKVFAGTAHDQYTAPASMNEELLQQINVAVTPQINTYTVNFESNGGSPVASQMINEGDTVARPVDPAKGSYTFGGWYTDDGVFANAWDFSNPVTADITLYAKWTANKYTVTFQTNGGSPVASQTISYGGYATKPETDPTKNGCTFAGWYTSGTFDSLFDFGEPITQDTTVYAKWIEDGYSLNCPQSIKLPVSDKHPVKDNSVAMADFIAMLNATVTNETSKQNINGVTFTISDYVNVDYNVTGKYNVTLSATFLDDMGNSKTLTKNMEVEVFDGIKPVINASNVILPVGKFPASVAELLSLAKAAVQDNYDDLNVNGLAVSFVGGETFGSINWTLANDYGVYLNITDSSGNPAEQVAFVVTVQSKNSGGSGGGNSGGTDKPDGSNSSSAPSSQSENSPSGGGSIPSGDSSHSTSGVNVPDSDYAPIGNQPIPMTDLPYTGIFDDDVPLASLPKTGRPLSNAMSSLASIGVLLLLGGLACGYQSKHKK